MSKRGGIFDAYALLNSNPEGLATINPCGMAEVPSL